MDRTRARVAWCTRCAAGAACIFATIGACAAPLLDLGAGARDSGGCAAATAFTLVLSARSAFLTSGCPCSNPCGMNSTMAALVSPIS